MGLFGGGLQTQQKIEFPASSGVTGANNGLSLDGTIAVLGGDVGAPSQLLDGRYISTFGTPGIFFIGTDSEEFFQDLNISNGSITGVSALLPSIEGGDYVASSFGTMVTTEAALVYSAWNNAGDDPADTGELRIGVGNSLDGRWPNAGFIWAAEGAPTGLDFIDIVVDKANAFLKFSTEGNERMRVTASGELLIARTASLNVAFKMQLGDGSQDTRALYNPNSNYAFGVRNGAFAGADSRTYYIGASNELNAALLFSNGFGEEQARLTHLGLFGINTDTPLLHLDVRTNAADYTTMAARFGVSGDDASFLSINWRNIVFPNDSNSAISFQGSGNISWDGELNFNAGGTNVGVYSIAGINVKGGVDAAFGNNPGGYGFGGASAVNGGIWCDAITTDIYIVNPTNGADIIFGTAITPAKFGRFDGVNNGLELNGYIQTSLGNPWELGAVVGGAAVLDGANYVTVIINGVNRKLALIV